MRRSLLLDRDGAAPNSEGDVDAPVPAHYGSPLREQNALEAGRAVTALARDVVAVTGPDRVSWLTTLSSQVLTGLTPGDGGAETLLLDAQGHVDHAMAALDDGERLLLVTEAGDGEALAAFLDSMRFMLRVEVASLPDVVALGAMGDGIDALEAAATDAGAHLGTWRDPWPGVTDGGTSYDVGLERPHPGTGYRAGLVLVPEDHAEAVAVGFLRGGEDRPGASRSLAGSLAWEALRVEAGRPRWAREVDSRVIPHELDWLRTAVHVTKGCYPGQETIARTLNLGRPPRRLTVLQLDGLAGELPLPGAVVRLGEKKVGTVTSVVRHHDLGPMALALIKRNVPADAALTVEVTEDPAEIEEGAVPEVLGRVDAAQELLVTPEGRAAASPAQRPGEGLRKSLLH